MTESVEEFLGHLYEARGYMRSVAERRCVDLNGASLPWFSYPAIDYLSGLDLSAKRVFEFGCGDSTLFFSGRCRSVVAVENAPDWHARIAGANRANVRLILAATPQEYLAAIAGEGSPYDIIVIDGDAAFVKRTRMAAAALGHLAADGLIILDNSDAHGVSAALLRASGLLQVDMVGLAPGNRYEQATSFFFSRQCRLEPQGLWQPQKTVGCNEIVTND